MLPIKAHVDRNLELEPKSVLTGPLEPDFPLTSLRGAQFQLFFALARGAYDRAVDSERNPRLSRRQKAQVDFELKIGQVVIDPAADLDRIDHLIAGPRAGCRRDRGCRWTAGRVGFDENQIRLLELLPELADVAAVVEDDHLAGQTARTGSHLGLRTVIRWRRRWRLRVPPSPGREGSLPFLR